MSDSIPSDAGVEFDRQLQNLIDLGYADLAGVDRERFVAMLAPLREIAARKADTALEEAAGRVPFLLVVTRQVAAVEQTMALTTLSGRTKPGFVDRSFEPGALARFVATERTAVPDARAYVLFDVVRGEEFCDVVPEDAMTIIDERGRTPLTIEEGIALITQYPQLLVKNKCFSLGGSRSGDRRVPAIWISQHAPKLGWCWEGNPHTWLGMASAGEREGPGWRAANSGRSDPSEASH